MIDPESVSSADLLLFDTILDRLHEARRDLALLRARQFTRDYDRARIAAKRKPAPTPMHTQDDAPQRELRSA